MDSLEQREERKRVRSLTPLKRWRMLQETITWAESQSTVLRNTPARCLAEQSRKNQAHDREKSLA